jgi:hypothetical protein
MFNQLQRDKGLAKPDKRIIKGRPFELDSSAWRPTIGHDQTWTVCARICGTRVGRYLADDDFWLVPHPSLLVWVPVVFCPPSILSVSLIDVDPSSGVVVEVWIVIALLNSALYAGVGAWIGRRWSRQA